MKRKKKKIFASFIIAVFLLLTNNFLGRDIMDLLIQSDFYKYSNYSGTFTGKDINHGILISNVKANKLVAFQTYVDEVNPPAEDRVLYRVFWRNPLYFWRWYAYFADDRYDLPYKNWKEIEKRRDENPQIDTNLSQWQSF